MLKYAPTHKDYIAEPTPAPFNSSSIRDIERVPRNFIPGPGIYDTAVGSFDVIKKKKDSLMNQIMTKLSSAKAPFNSQTQRFEENTTATQLLGPGQYFQ